MLVISTPGSISITRTASERNKKFDWDIRTLQKRISSYKEHIGNIEALFTETYANTKNLEGGKSVWNLENTLKRYLENTMKMKMNYGTNWVKEKPREISGLNIIRKEYALNQGYFKNFCPVCFKMQVFNF